MVEDCIVFASILPNVWYQNSGGALHAPEHAPELAFLLIWCRNIPVYDLLISRLKLNATSDYGDYAVWTPSRNIGAIESHSQFRTTERLAMEHTG